VLPAGAFFAIVFGLWGQPQFEVASVKVSTASQDSLPIQFRGFGRQSGGPGSTTPGQYTATGISLKNILFRRAFPLNEYQYVAPSWMDKEVYDIAVKAPPGITQDQFSVMLQNLLIQRFKIELHHEQREHASYDMVLAKGGSRMKPSKFDETVPLDAGPGSGSLKLEHDADGFPSIPDAAGPMTLFTARNGQTVVVTNRFTVQQLIDYLALNLNIPIFDKTGLKGGFAYMLHYERPGIAAVSADAGASPAMNVTPTLFDALQSQLGLKLEPHKAMIDVLVIDKAEKKPIEN